MTPELPRAPISDPREMARQVAAMSVPLAPSETSEPTRPSEPSEPSTSSRALTTDSTVRTMLVPVSPSGTG